VTRESVVYQQTQPTLYPHSDCREASGVHAVQSTWSRGFNFRFNTVCVATWRTHCSGTNVYWTSGDPQGWCCSSQDGQVRKQ